MSFRDFDEFIDSRLRLPIRGKTYVIESPDAKTGMWIQEAVTLAARVKAGDAVGAGDLASLELDDDQEKDLYKRVLGPVHAQMVDDGVPWEALKRAGITALIWVAGDTETAEQYWNSGGDPKAAAKAPQDHKRKGSGKSGRRVSRASSPSQQSVEDAATPGPTS